MKGSWNSISLVPITLSFLFFFNFIFQDVFAAPTRRHLCRSDQRDAILDFKNEFKILKPCFDIPSPPKTESWTNDSDCCYWDGITCDDKSGEVIELDLSFSCLHGQINSKSALFRLHNLRFLNTLRLSNNYLSGQIPSSLRVLSHLTTLDLSINNFSGQIPFSLGNLSHLTFLDLSNNHFSCQILSSLENLSKLTTLKLFNNYFSGWIPYSIGNLSNLTILRLSRNNFVGEIPSSLGSLLHLTILSLYRNNFVGGIPFSLGNLSHLNSLDIYFNNIFGEIPISLGILSNLTSLILSFNNFVSEIPSSFGSLNNLTILHVESNKLSGSFPLALLNLKKLSFLSLSNNQFTGTLPSSLFTISSLDTIILENNQFKGTLEFRNISSSSKLVELRLGNNKFREPIPISISKLVNLVTLDLSHFNTQGSVDISILFHLKSLRYLYMSHLNTTTTIDLNVILSSFKSLFSLDLSGNHVSITNKSSALDPPSVLISHQLYLSGCGISEVPELLRTQHKMMELDLSNNKIKGQVPSWLWMLPILVYVNLSNNTFISFERSTKHGLSYVPEPPVRHLFASNNNFTGKIPSFICVLHSLKTLDLSNNNLNGSFPSCMVNLKSTLSVLNLHHNRLSGGLPDNIFESLRSLDVGHNQLVGKLPRSLIQLSFLEVLNVESNKINDTFPFWLSSLQELQVLVLRSNAFHGPIQLTRFSKLRIIDISRNHFSGTLPSHCFENWSAMFSLGQNEDPYIGMGYYHDSMVLMSKGLEMKLVRIIKIFSAIDFSGNILEGEIPWSVGLLKDLHVLNLSNNAFTGHIPSSMGNLTALESLDVSQNKLSGEIPQELGNLSFLAYINFSHNKLVGLVPGGTQFRRQPCSSFKYNPGIYGSSLDEVCVDIHATTSQQSETPEPQEDEEEVISWIAAAIGFIPGITFGLTMGYILISYKPEWFINAFGRNKRRNLSTTAH